MGQGNMFSESGIAVGSTPEGAGYLVNGTWHNLVAPHPELMNYAQGITPDGSLIVGMGGLANFGTEDTEVPMMVPLIWTRNADGTYADGVILPYPATDFTGRVPQYVTALCVSDDGHHIYGQVQDYSGSMTSLIAYNLNESGEWEYDVRYNKMCNPDNLEFPEFPGDAPQSPSLLDFMTEDEKNAYNDAVDAWTALGTYDYSTYPNVEDYATDEEKAAYQAALAAWEEAFAAWSEQYQAFDEIFLQCVLSGKALMFNNIILGPDGKTVYSTVAESIEDPMSWTGFSDSYTPAMVNIKTAEYSLLPNKNVILSSVAADNTILGFTETMETPRQTWIYLPGSTEPVSLIQYYDTYLPETAAWVREKMVHDVEMYNFETGKMETVFDMEFTGTSHVDKDMKVLATAVANLCDTTIETSIFTFVVPSMAADVKGVASETLDAVKVSALRGGRIIVKGTDKNISVFDTNGRIVFSADNCTGVIRTGLESGAYIVKATTSEGVKAIKTIF